MNKVTSTVVKSYEVTDEGLLVELTSGATYLYKTATPELVQNFETAKSKGEFYAKHIRPLPAVKQ